MGNDIGKVACQLGTVAACAVYNELKNRQRAPDENNAAGQNPKHSDSKVHMLMLALDYPGTGNELTCTQDGDNMKVLLQSCGLDDIVCLYNNEANYAAVSDGITQVLSRCNEGDFFFFYYSGHGANVEDESGDEADGQDEALCLVTPDGRLDWEQFMTDDQFAELVSSNCPEGVNVIIMCDCCHSGTIGDFGEELWDNIRAISLSGCRDGQTSGDTGRGGIFTHSLLMAIQTLQDNDNDDYSVAQLYNGTLTKDDEVFNSEQEITMKWTTALGAAENMAWPLVPQTNFQAPWNGMS